MLLVLGTNLLRKSPRPLLYLLLGDKDRNTRRQTSQRDSRTHERNRANHIGQKYGDSNRHALVDTKFVLNCINDRIEISCDSNGEPDTNGSNDIIEHPKSCVDGQEGFPLSGCQRGKTCLFAEDIPSKGDSNRVRNIGDPTIGQHNR